MWHYLMLSRGNFCAKKQHSNKVLPFGGGGPLIMPHHVVIVVTVVDSVYVWRYVLC